MSAIEDVAAIASKRVKRRPRAETPLGSGSKILHSIRPLFFQLMRPDTGILALSLGDQPGLLKCELVQGVALTDAVHNGKQGIVDQWGQNAMPGIAVVVHALSRGSPGSERFCQ